MTDPVPVVDLFSGPGGLAEGFAALKDPLGCPRFNVVLSIEMDPTAHRTLLLRGFLRKFPSGYPPAFYDFLQRGPCTGTGLGKPLPARVEGGL